MAQTTDSRAQRLAKLERACGCGEGAAAMIAALVLGGVFLVPARWPEDGPVLALAEWVGLVLAAAFLGKAAGLAAARLRARGLRRSLAAERA